MRPRPSILEAWSRLERAIWRAIDDLREELGASGALEPVTVPVTPAPREPPRH